MGQRVEDHALENKLKRVGFSIGIAAGSIFYSVGMFEILKDVRTFEDAATKVLVYGFFIGPLIAAGVCETVRSITTECLSRHYLNNRV
ncbi:MAG: hypothetical protein KKD18_06480 [Nanoarchaeota archaeon]|nr:hypothetical protein [Nanoarchaeota archaeon]MBU0978039.1 hypothetical protein [Nanoarchaeota archaeon]